MLMIYNFSHFMYYFDKNYYYYLKLKNFFFYYNLNYFNLKRTVFFLIFKHFLEFDYLFTFFIN